MNKKLLCVFTTVMAISAGTLLFSACGDENEVDTSCQHDYGTVITQPTCTDKGYTTYTCSKCDNSYVGDYVNALGHDTVNHEAKPVTCTQDGWNAYETCTRCDYTTFKEIKTTGHSLINYGKEAATCTEAGYEAYEACRNCDYTTYKEIKALGHDMQPHAAQAPGCTELGWDAYEACSRCEETTNRVIKDPLGHDIQNGSCIRCKESEYILNTFAFWIKSDGTYAVSILNDFEHDATDVTEIVIPSQYNGKAVTSIRDYGFALCRQLASVTIPESITLIGNYAFGDCESLTKITIPATVKQLGYSVFEDSDCLVIYCENASKPSGWDKEWNYTKLPVVWNCKNNNNDADGNIYIEYNSLTFGLKNGKATLLRQPTNLSGKITVPSKITYNSEEYILTAINDDTFKSCRNITGVKIENGVTSIGDEAFSDCRTMTEVELPDSVTNIGVYAFEGCTELVTINIPVGVKIISSGIFSKCKSLSSIIIPDGVTFIGQNAFEECSSLTEINIPKGVVTIESYTFYECENLRTVTLPDGLIKIDRNAFGGCKNLTTVNIPDTVTTIKNNAFSGCAYLLTITIPKSVTTIDGYAFNGCGNLIISCEATQAPYGWDEDWNVIKLPVIWDCKNNTLDSNGNLYTISDGIRYALKDGKASVNKASNAENEFVIPSTITFNSTEYPVTAIDDLACYQNDKITSLTIPEGVTVIGSDAFGNCHNLVEVKLPESLKTIKNNAFFYCDNLPSINIPDGVTTIEHHAFAWCDLKEVKLSNGLTSVGDYAFDGKFTSLTIPKSVTELGYWAFRSENVVIYCEAASKPAGWNSDWHVYDVPVVWNCTVNDKATDGFIYEIYDGVRYALKDGKATANLAISIEGDIQLPATITYKDAQFPLTAIGEKAFKGCYDLTGVIIPEGVTSIGIAAFENCFDLISVQLPQSLTTIHDHAFDGCFKESSIVIPKSVTTMGERVFTFSVIVIYCEAEQQPAGWDKDWNLQAEVVWGFEIN